MKKGLLLTLFCLIAIAVFGDSNATTAIKRLTERVESLEEVLKWVKYLGIPIFGITSFWAIYMWFKGIKDKVNSIIETDAEKKIEEKSTKILNNKLIEYPFIQEYERIQKLKNEKLITIVGPTSKDINLIESLERMGFKSPSSISIKEILDLEKVDGHLILFDNRSGELSQNEMDSVVQKMKGQVHFFYFNSEGGQNWQTKWQGKEKLGFANSLGRLEQNLTDLFKQI